MNNHLAIILSFIIPVAVAIIAAFIVYIVNKSKTIPISYDESLLYYDAANHKPERLIYYDPEKLIYYDRANLEHDLEKNRLARDAKINRNAKLYIETLHDNQIRDAILNSKTNDINDYDKPYTSEEYNAILNEQK